MKTLQKSAGTKPDARTGAAGPRSKSLFDEEQLYFTPGLQSIALFSEIAMERGKGCMLEDADGRQYLDFVAGIGVASIGPLSSILNVQTGFKFLTLSGVIVVSAT